MLEQYAWAMGYILGVEVSLFHQIHLPKGDNVELKKSAKKPRAKGKMMKTNLSGRIIRIYSITLLKGGINLKTIKMSSCWKCQKARHMIHSYGRMVNITIIVVMPEAVGSLKHKYFTEGIITNKNFLHHWFHCSIWVLGGYEL